MVAVLISALFVIAAMLALGSLVHSWQRYGHLALAARSALQDTAKTREVRFRIVEVKRSNVVQLPIRRRAEPVPLRAAA